MTQHCTQDERLLDYLYEEMSAQDAEAFSAHVQACAHCRAELQQLRGVRTAFHDLPAPEPRPEALQRMTAQLLHQAAQHRRGGNGQEQEDEAGADNGGAAGGGVLGKLLAFRRRPLMKMLMHPAGGLLVAAAATLTLVVVSRDWQKNLAPIHQPTAAAPTQQAHEVPAAAPVVPPAQTTTPEPPAQQEIAKQDESPVTGSTGGTAGEEQKAVTAAHKGGSPQFQVMQADKTSARLRSAPPLKAKATPQEDLDSLADGEAPSKKTAGPAPAPAPVYAKKPSSPFGPQQSKLAQNQAPQQAWLGAKDRGGLVQQAPPPPPPGMPAPTDTPARANREARSAAEDSRYAQPPPPEAQQQAPPAAMPQQMAKAEKAASPANSPLADSSGGGDSQAAMAPVQAQAQPTQMPSQAPAAGSVPRQYQTNADGLKVAQQAPLGSLSSAGRGQSMRGYSDDVQESEVLQQQTRHQQRSDLNHAVGRPAAPAALAQNEIGSLRADFHKFLRQGQCQQAEETLRKLENRFPSSPDDAVNVGLYQKSCGVRPGTEIAQPQAAPMQRRVAKPSKKMRAAAPDEQNAAPNAAPPEQNQNQNQNQAPATDNAKK